MENQKTKLSEKINCFLCGVETGYTLLLQIFLQKDLAEKYKPTKLKIESAAWLSQETREEIVDYLIKELAKKKH